MVGKTVEEAGLRQLPGLFLIEINRNGDVVTPVTPRDIIHVRDRLIFTGVVSTIIDLEKIPGLIPAADESYEFHPHKRQQRQLIEAVIARSSPCVGRTIREANFRELYNAAVVAVHRNGARLPSKIGDILLEPGDTLLLQTRGEFVETHTANPDFYLVRNVEGSEPRRHDKGWLAGGLTLFLILWLTGTSWLPVTGPWGALGNTAIASIVVALLLIAFRCIPIAAARDSLDLQTLITIAASLGVGLAMSESGAAAMIATSFVGLVDLAATSEARPYVLLITIYILGAVMTEMITNNAVAAMLFPLAVSLAEAGGYSPRPYIMAITLAASMSFCTPIGYQTNLMVMGPGGYQPSDYLKAGAPLAVLMAIVALTAIPWVWAF
jgi:di/tricarboxylate transporter